MKGTIALSFLVALLWPGPLLADGTAWWDREWKHRRTVHVRPPEGALPGKDVGVVSFLTGGLVQPDGRDIRVVNRRDAVPSKVLMMGPGDRCLVIFEMVPGQTVYHVYNNNPRAKASDLRWAPQRGVLLESWQWRGGKVDTFRQAQESIKNAKPKQGAGFVPQINLGWNPFGPSENYVHIFTAWLNCPEEGRYTFAVSAEHAAFVLIDGRMAVQRGGWGRPPRRANIRGQAQLARGLHLVKFYHIEGRGRWNSAVLAWSLPSWRKPNPKRQKYEVIPAGAYAPVAHAKLIDLENLNRTLVPDFTAENIGKAWLTADHYLIKYRFTAVLKAAQALGARLTWDFGDGTSSTAVMAEHIYVNPGTYTVALTVTKNDRRYTARNRLVVEQDWNTVHQRRIDGLGRYAREVQRRDYTALTPADLDTIVDVFRKLKQSAEVVRAGRVLLLHLKGVDDRVLYEKAMLLAGIMESGKQYDETLRMLAAVGKRVKGPAWKARLLVHAGEVRLWYKRDTAGAGAVFEQVLSQYGTIRDDAVRRATIRLADVRRKQGDREKAVALYEQAAAIKPIDQPFQQSLVRPGAPKAIRVSSYARTVEAFIFEKNLADAELLLDSWEWDYPKEKLKGHSALLRARLWAARGDHRQAADEAEDLAAFDERNPYVPEAVFLAAQSYEALKDAARAAAAYRRILNDYPESPLVPEAKKRLAALGRPRS